ncbi:MAG: hypothetical protein P8M16_08690 [Acidimicrobiales bacterium]|nr:hypothetical protein [Acidimicrobiales bacterium]
MPLPLALLINIGAVLATSGNSLVPFISLAGCGWSWAVSREGSEFRRDPDRVPDYVPGLNLACGVVGAAMLIFGLSQ